MVEDKNEMMLPAALGLFAGALAYFALSRSEKGERRLVELAKESADMAVSDLLEKNKSTEK